MTFAEYIESKVKEPIEAVVIGAYGWEVVDNKEYRVPEHVKGKILDWPTAREYLSYDYVAGAWSLNCHAVYIWTADRVYFVVTYDGNTTLYSVPGAPRDEVPKMCGTSG